MSTQAIQTETLETLVQEFKTKGFCLARGLFDADEVRELQEHFTRIHDEGVPGKYEPMSIEEAGDDILLAYPRVMNPHRWSDTARKYLTHAPLAQTLRALFEEEPLAVQSMFYYKPPGSRGQKMHQDNFYLQVKPGTCIASWTALDYCDRKNGGMVMVPFTHGLGIDCRNVGKTGSYEKGGNAIPIPDGYRGESPAMEPGDTLFFNGSVIHGSGGNHTKDRWRRSFIGHYVGVSCDTLSKSYHPLVTMDGRDVERGITTNGGPCGAWVGAAH
jgi:ectoine hydroxylase-related dioxygenase (phytanoyl-CoA dioxygenase family)